MFVDVIENLAASQLKSSLIFEDAFRNRSSSFSVVLSRSACIYLLATLESLSKRRF